MGLYRDEKIKEQPSPFNISRLGNDTTSPYMALDTRSKSSLILKQGSLPSQIVLYHDGWTYVRSYNNQKAPLTINVSSYDSVILRLYGTFDIYNITLE